MIKRPLFAGCIVAVSMLGGLLYMRKESFISPALRAQQQLSEGENVYIKGVIERIEQKENQTVLTVKRAEIKLVPDERKSLEAKEEKGQEKEKTPSCVLKSCGLLLYVKDCGTYSIGETILGKGTLKFIEPLRNPGQFHAENYYRAKGIDYRIFSAQIIKSDGKGNWYLNGLARLSKRLAESIQKVFSEEDSGLMESILLGSREDLDEDIYSLYQLAGIAHLLAVSGLHIGLIGRGIYGLLRRFGASFFFAFFLSILFLLSYVFLTGMGPSAFRAFLMFGLAMFAKVCGRANDLLTSAALALLFMSLENPWILTQSGVWLSFGAVFAIGGIYPALEQFFSPKRGIGKGLLLSFSIQLLTIPVLCNSYFQISIYSVFLNVLVLPLMSVVFLSGALAAAFGLILPFMGRLSAFPAHLILKLYGFLAKFFLRLPGACFLTGKPENWQIFLYYMILGLLILFIKRCTKKKKEDKIAAQKAVLHRQFLQRAVILSICVLLPLVLCYTGKKGLCITMLDVGQGDGIYIRLPEGQKLFLDGGSSSEKEVGVYRIEPFLKAVRTRRMDIWSVSHGDSDHYSGLMEVFDEVEAGNFSIGELWLPDVSNPGEGQTALENRAGELSVPVKKISEGMVYRNGDFILTCLHPAAGYESESENACSTSLLLQYKSFSGLFTGDVEKGGEEAVRAALKKYGAENLTFLKTAHHGSANSTTEKFCDGLEIKFAFISAGKNNSYGHPAEEVVERLEEKGAKLYSTIEGGALMLWSDGDKLTIKEFKQ